MAESERSGPVKREWAVVVVVDVVAVVPGSAALRTRGVGARDHCNQVSPTPKPAATNSRKVPKNKGG